MNKSFIYFTSFIGLILILSSFLIPKLDFSSPIFTAKSYKTNAPVDQKYISSIIEKNKSIFVKCFADSGESTIDPKQEFTVNLTIEPTGYIRFPRISSIDNIDSDLEACIKMSLNRIKFKSFKGESITTQFQLRFK